MKNSKYLEPAYPSIKNVDKKLENTTECAFQQMSHDNLSCICMFIVQILTLGMGMMGFSIFWIVSEETGLSEIA